MENKSCVFLHCALLISNPLLREDFISLTCFTWKTNFWCATAKTGMQSPDSVSKIFFVILTLFVSPCSFSSKALRKCLARLLQRKPVTTEGHHGTNCHVFCATGCRHHRRRSFGRAARTGVQTMGWCLFFCPFFPKKQLVDLRRYYDSHFYPLKKKKIVLK